MKTKKITIGINASFLRKPNTGIGQATYNFLRKLNEMQSASWQTKYKFIEFILYLEEELPKDLKLPKNFETRVFLPLWKRDDLVRKIWWEKNLLPKKVEGDNCDLFISLYQSATILSDTIKHLMVVHDIVPEIFPEYLNNLRKRKYWNLTKDGLIKADYLIAVSRRTEKDMIQKLGLPGEKISVVYEDIDSIYKENISEKESSRVLRKYKLKPGYILAGGGMEVRKNVEGVIRAYKFLEERFKLDKTLPKLVIFGKLLPQLAPLATDAEKLIQELNLTKNVKLLDMVSQKDLPALYKNAMMFVYPSKYEGFGLPVLEAMNVGTPVITSKTSSLPEVGGDAVLYCNPHDVHDIAMVMRNVFLNKDLRDTLERRGQERVKNFSWEKFTEKIFNIIENL